MPVAVPEPLAAPASRANAVRTVALVAVLFAAIAIVFSYPLSLHSGSAVAADKPDTHLFIWTLAWDVHAFTAQPFSIFDANIYFPLPRTLAFSENLIGLALLAAPFQWATGNPVLAMNCAALTGCIIGAVGAFVLARRLGFSVPASVVCGLVFGFSPARFLRTWQLHVGAVYWIPFALAGLHAYLDTGSRRQLRWAVACFSLQALTSGHGAVYLTYAVLGLFAFRVLLGEPVAVIRRIRDIGVTGLLLFSPTVWVTLPYRQVHAELGFQRWASNWNMNWGSFLASQSKVHEALLSLSGLSWVTDEPKAYLFPGYVPLVLAALAWWWAPSRSGSPAALSSDRPQRTSWLQYAGAILEIAGVLALAIAALIALTGPVRFVTVGDVLVSVRGFRRPLWIAVGLLAARGALFWFVPFQTRRLAAGAVAWWIERPRDRWRRDPVVFYSLFTLLAVWMLLPTPFGLWGYVWPLPGLSSLRVAGRTVVVAVLGLAVLAAAGFEGVLERLQPTARRWAPWIASIVMLVEFAPMPLPVVPFTIDTPAADQYVASRPGTFAVAELPVRHNARIQTRYMLHSMAHWQKTIHGYSGYEARLHSTLYKELRLFPTDAGVQRLRELGVRYLIVHGADYPPLEWEDVDRRLRARGDALTLEFESDLERVYALH